MEKRLRSVEETLTNYGRRHDDCEKDRKQLTAMIHEIIAWKETVQEATEVNRKMVEVGENILLALSWVGTAAKWIIAIGGAVAVVYAAIKGMMTLGFK